MKKIFLVLGLSLLLVGCESAKSVLEGGLSPIAQITNPVGKRELAAVEATYRVAVSAAVNYRRLGLCREGQVESVQNLCARQAVVLQLQDANRKARVALTNARAFVRNNPTVSAFTVINAARSAVSEFQTVLAQNGVR